MKDDVIKLSNGIEIPNLCFGSGIVCTYRYGDVSKKAELKYWIKNFLKNRKQFRLDYHFPKVLRTAMQNGCTMFDTSRAYGGAEYELGKALKNYSREQYHVITKLSNSDQYKGDVKGALKKSLKELGLEYVDLYLMHWPVDGIYLDNWKKMEELYKEGFCKAIGVCNCNIHHLKEIEKIAEIMPMVNEFECHPLFTQEELRNYCKDAGIQVLAYTATGRMDERLNKTALVPIAKKYKKSVAQVILRWHQMIGNIPIVNSSNELHLIENTEINDFALTKDEIDRISAININSRLRYDPDNCDFKQL